MHCLFLDIASSDGLLACVTDDAVSASKDVQSPVGDHDLVPMLAELCSEAGWSEESPYDGVDRIACIVGPGGFTSLRVAVTYANVLADQLDVPLAGIHQSDAYRARCNEDDVLWLHSTKRSELFVRGFGSHASLWPEATHIGVDAALQQVPKGALWMGELLEEHRDAMENKGLTAASLKELHAVLPNLLRSLEFRPDTLVPWYGRGG